MGVDSIKGKTFSQLILSKIYAKPQIAPNGANNQSKNNTNTPKRTKINENN